MNNIINRTIWSDTDHTDDILLTADWHLWIKDRINKTDKVFKRPNFDKIVSMYQEIPRNKMLIHLGDLTDDEMTDANKLIDVMKTITCTKILVLGNNDKFPIDVYEKCGFSKIYTNGFVFNNILFTHAPEDHDYDLNVHGHSHGHKYYWNCHFHRHLDIWNIDRTPVKFNDLHFLYEGYREGIIDISEMNMTGAEFKKWRGFYNGKKAEEF